MVRYNSTGPSNKPNWYNQYFDVTGTVGWGCKNHKDDVMLVQLLLRRYHARRSAQGFPTNPALIVKVDGIFGDKTAGAIVSYQSRGANVVDGKVDPGKTTIRSLNVMYKSDYLQFQGKPFLDPDAPPLLKQSSMLAYNSIPQPPGLPDIGY